MGCVELNYITTPIGVPTIFGKQPNELLFSDRHSYLLSTPDTHGELPWFVWGGKVNTGLPQFSVGQNIIESSGVQEHGSRVTMLRAGSRAWSGIITIRPDVINDRTSFTRNMQLLYSMLSYDNATSITSNNELPLPFSIPNPFTYTWVNTDSKRYHIDFAVAWLDGFSDSTTPAPTLFDGTLSFYSPKSSWYGDVIRLTNQSNRAVDNIIVPEFSYYGTARTSWTFTSTLYSVPSTVQLNEIRLVDITDTNSIRIGSIKPVTGETWTWFNSQATQTISLDVERRQLTINGTVINSIDPISLPDWTSLYLVPYRRYRVDLLTTPYDVDTFSTNNYVDTTFTYSPQYVGI